MDNSRDFTGHVPKSMPIGMAYVPMQQPERIYVDEMALQRGTIYPGLDLPFKSYENREPLPQTPMTEAMQCDFICHDLGLYLDTHPSDEDIRKYYNHRLVLSREAHDKYLKNCGPLTKQDGYHDGNDWLTSPWPWEVCERGDC